MTRGDVVVVVPVYGARELFEECLRSVVEHTTPGTRVLVADDASPDPGIEAFTAQLAAGAPVELDYVRRPENLGFVGNMNAAFAETAPADVVIVNSDTVVPAAWLERLRAAAYSDGLVATASTLTNHGTILSVPDCEVPVAAAPGRALDHRGRRARSRAPRRACTRASRPASGTACTSVAPRSSWSATSTRRSRRATARRSTSASAASRAGCVTSSPTTSTSSTAARARSAAPARSRQQANEDELNRRYPYYAKAVRRSRDVGDDAARALAGGGAAGGRRAVGDDRRLLPGPDADRHAGARTRAGGALARRGDVRLRVTVPRSLGDRAREALDGMGIERMWHDEADESTEPSDIVHRPYQVTTPRDLLLLGRLGRRVVLTQLDAIAYHNPAYFTDHEEWRGYRELTRQALAFAHRVVFCSPHARDDSLAEDLVDDERAALVALGIDHRVVVADGEPVAPPGVEGRPFLLCLGTDFLHKNHPFALALFQRLREAHGFDGRLVLAGPHALRGTSEGEEAAWRAANPSLAADVIALGEAPEAQKAWLYRHAALVLYPTTFEGFGFIPFEAAEAGAPSLWANQSSMADLLPSEHAGIVPWDVEASAANARAADRRPAAARGGGPQGGRRADLGPLRRAAPGRLPRRRDRTTARLGRAARVALRPRDVARRPWRLAEPRRPAGPARRLRPPGAEAHRLRRAEERLPGDVPRAAGGIERRLVGRRGSAAERQRLAGWSGCARRSHDVRTTDGWSRRHSCRPPRRKSPRWDMGAIELTLVASAASHPLPPSPPLTFARPAADAYSPQTRVGPASASRACQGAVEPSAGTLRVTGAPGATAPSAVWGNMSPKRRR